MKKTFAILMAMAGVAMGADILPDAQWDGTSDKLELDFSDNVVTVALTLNWDIIKQYSLNEDAYFFTLEDEEGKLEGAAIDMSDKTESKGWIGGWHTQGTGNVIYRGNPIDQEIKDLSVYIQGVIVYTAKTNNSNSANTDMTMDIYLWKQDGTKVEYNSGSKTFTNHKFGTIDCLNVNQSNILSAEVYKRVLLEDERDLIADKLYAASIPEPTTATLSLLALAGLAARRRRK